MDKRVSTDHEAWDFLTTEVMGTKEWSEFQITTQKNGIKLYLHLSNRAYTGYSVTAAGIEYTRNYGGSTVAPTLWQALNEHLGRMPGESRVERELK